MSLMFAVYAKAPGATIENLLVDAGSPDAEFSDAAIELGQQVARFHMSSIASEELLIHNDLNTSNIMFDAETHRFSLVDTEDAKLSRDPQLAIHNLFCLACRLCKTGIAKRKMNNANINFLVKTFLTAYTDVLAKNSGVGIVNDVLKLVVTVDSTCERSVGQTCRELVADHVGDETNVGAATVRHGVVARIPSKCGKVRLNFQTLAHHAQ